MKATVGEARTTTWVNKTRNSVKLDKSCPHQCNNPTGVIREGNSLRRLWIKGEEERGH